MKELYNYVITIFHKYKNVGISMLEDVIPETFICEGLCELEEKERKKIEDNINLCDRSELVTLVKIMFNKVNNVGERDDMDIDNIYELITFEMLQENIKNKNEYCCCSCYKS